MSKVLVIGGGIGGLSTAIGLKNAGLDVDIVEISPGREVYHVGIIVQANFLRALDKLGVADQAIARGFPYAGFDLRNKDGGLDAYIPGVALSREGHPTDLGLTRPALHEVLADRCEELGVTPRFGLTFESFEQSDERVTVTFTDGSVSDYDFVIGSDGLFSKTRTALFGDKYIPQFTGQAVWRYNLPRPAEVIRTAMYQGVPGGKAGYCPLTDETMYLLLVMAEPGKPWLAKEDLPRLFKERLAPFGGRIAEIRDNTDFDPDLIVYRPLEAVFVSEPWYKGRILLVGDAAHGTTPHLGQGAAQAVEDAATLAGLAEEHLPVETMFARFVEKRFDRCKFIWESSLQIGKWEMANDPTADVQALSHKVLQTVSAPL
jgi:2-polyprenyl-6-methoxyphenol hydroxylase-like FAD-dependent oxidoreductase